MPQTKKCGGKAEQKRKRVLLQLLGREGDARWLLINLDKLETHRSCAPHVPGQAACFFKIRQEEEEEGGNDKTGTWS